MRRILALAPADARLLAAAVCREWREMLNERRLWLRVDLSRESGLSHALTEGLLRAATARAGGALQSLDVTGCSRQLHATLLAVAAANAGTLRELRIASRRSGFHLFPHESSWTLQELQALLRAAPQLVLLEANAGVSVADARPLLRNEPSFGPLQLRYLEVEGDATNQAEVLGLIADVTTHPSLTGLTMQFISLDAPELVEAVVDAALARRLSSLQLDHCCLSPASAPALVRLLASDALRELALCNLVALHEETYEQDRMFEGVAAALLAGAFCANTTLTALCVQPIGLWDDFDAAAVLLRALVAHPSLRVLNLHDYRQYNAQPTAAHAAAAGDVLGALVAANAPALTELDVSFCHLRDEALTPLVGALASNTHLRVLICADTS